MADKRDEHTWLRTGALVIVALVAVAGVLWYTRAVMIPFVLAVFVVSLVSPILDVLVIRLRFPRFVAVMITFLVVIVIIVILCLLATHMVQRIIAKVDQYSQNFADLANKAFLEVGRWGEEFNREKIIGDLRNRVPKLVTNTLGAVFSLLSSVFLVLIIVIFLLAGRNPYAVRRGVYADIDLEIRRYIVIKVGISTLTGVLVWAALTVIGLELAGVFGMLAFLLNFIPSIGSIVSTFLPIPIAVAQFQSPWPIIFVVAIPGMVQIIIGNVIEPKLMGEGLNLHPVTVLLALSFWGLLWGIGGMFLAAPLTAIIRIVFMQFDTLKPVGRLLAGELPGSQSAGS